MLTLEQIISFLDLNFHLLRFSHLFAGILEWNGQCQCEWILLQFLLAVS